ncbi:MAG: tetratricopeptide repeat protein [Planctomycetota bacterium]|jgi:tetratricopeptide (TPR) repeat protein
MRVLLTLATLLSFACGAFAQDAGDKAYAFELARAKKLAEKARMAGDGNMAREAVQAFTAAARLKPESVEPVFLAGELALALGDGSTMVRMLSRLKELDEDSGEFHFLRGLFLYRKGDFKDSTVEFRETVKLRFRPRESADWLFKGLLADGLTLIDKRDYEKAAVVLTEVVELRPDHPLVARAWYNMALAYRNLGEPKRSEKILKKCVKDHPTYAPPYGELGALLTEQDRHDEALEYLNQSVLVDPGYRQGYLLKITALVNRKRLKEAEEVFKEYARRFKEPTGDSEYRRGVFLHARKEPEKALKHLRHALQLNPLLIRCHYHVSLCHRDLGDRDAAKEAMERWKRADQALRNMDDAHREQHGDREDRNEGEKPAESDS